MNDRLFRQLINLALSEAEARRDECAPATADRDKWSAIAGHLDNARKRMRAA